MFGHQAAKRVFAVGAISAFDAGNDRIEPFSSRGPSKILIPSKQIRDKPDISGIDGVTTTGPGAFPETFFGTSAAAPHIAGLAALLLEFRPNRTPSEIKSAIKKGAVDLGSAGRDNTYGAGRANAVKAANKL